MILFAFFTKSGGMKQFSEVNPEFAAYAKAYPHCKAYFYNSRGKMV